MFPITQEQVDKARFVHQMGPYYLQAKSEELQEEFFAAVFTHYCDRWPLDISGYQATNSWITDLESRKRARTHYNHVYPPVDLTLPDPR